MPYLTVEDLLEINRVVALVHRFQDSEVHIKSIPFPDLSICAFADAAHQNTEEGSSPAGWIIMAAQKSIARGEMSDISPPHVEVP
jgi:hypothetical protein